MPAMTRHEEMIAKLEEAAEKHPQSYLVLDGETLEVIATGKDAEKTIEKAKKNLQPGHSPILYKKPDERQVLIL